MPKEKLFEIPSNLPQKILILSLMSLDLYYIICYNTLGKIFLSKYINFETTYGKIGALPAGGDTRPNAAAAHDESVCLFAFL